MSAEFCDRRMTLEEIPISLWKKLLYTSLAKKPPTNKNQKIQNKPKKPQNKTKYHPTNYPNKKHAKKAKPQSQLASRNMKVPHLRVHFEKIGSILS